LFYFTVNTARTAAETRKRTISTWWFRRENTSNQSCTRYSECWNQRTYEGIYLFPDVSYIVVLLYRCWWRIL